VIFMIVNFVYKFPCGPFSDWAVSRRFEHKHSSLTAATEIRRARWRGQFNFEGNIMMSTKKLRRGPGILMASICLLLPLSSAFGEDVSRPSVVGSRLERKYSFDQPNYNVKVGPVTFRVVAGLRTEFNDNINLSDNDRESDFVFRPQMGVTAFWPITPYNALNFTANFSYSKYLRHSELDDASKSFSIAPDSILDYDIFIGHFTLNLHDRFSIDQDPYGTRTDSRIGTFGQFMNSAGVRLTWDVNRALVLTLGYDHTNAIATQSSYDFTNYAQDGVVFSSRLVLSDKIAVGIEAAGAQTTYSTDDKANGTEFHTGPFIDLAFTEYTRLRLAGGYQAMYFDGSSAATIQVNPDNTVLRNALKDTRIQSEDQNTFYVNADFTNRLSSHFTQTLSFGRETSLAVTAQTVDLIYARYSGSWAMNSLITLNLQLFYENGRESAALQPENFNRYGGGLNTSFLLSRKLNMEIGYNFTKKDTDLSQQNYTQNVVYVGLNYNF